MLTGGPGRCRLFLSKKKGHMWRAWHLRERCVVTFMIQSVAKGRVWVSVSKHHQKPGLSFQGLKSQK